MDPKRNRIPGDDYRHLTNNESDRNVDEPFVLHHGDCREILAGMPDASIDAVVTDPPYELGFMGKGWDAAGIAYDVAMWAEVLRVLKPGGYLLAFGGTRTYHRMACAIEDAGFEIRDSVNWVYGSGFPKSLNVGKAIDKTAGAKRKVVGTKLGQPGYSLAPNDVQERTAYGKFSNAESECAVTAPATPEAERWDGWGTALKPAHEPIVVARKPLVGTVAANVLEHGTGALNIDGCRVDGKPRTTHKDGNWTGNSSVSAIFPMRNVRANEPQGRWPANLVLTHHADCRPAGMAEETVGDGEAGTSGFAAGYESGDGFVGRTVGATVWDCHPECPAAVLDAQSGVSKDGVAVNRNGHDPERRGYDGGWGTEPRPDQGYGGSGGASRFFTQTAWDDELDGWSFLYQAKANKRERNAGTPDGNKHPTVKPVELMRWLVRMVTPPDGTVLDPFTGSGTTGIAATLEGFTFIGIEQDADYIEQIARPRILHHLHTTLDYATVLEPAPKPDDPQPVNPSDDQPTLF